MSNEEIKKLIHKIIEEEKENTKTFMEVSPVTCVEFSKSSVFNKKLSLKKRITNFGAIVCVGGFNDLCGNIVIFINKYKKIRNIDRSLFNILRVSYHEARHSVQQYFEWNTFEGFFNKIDQNNINLIYYLDRKTHDKKIFEIDANIYGVEKAIEYLKQNNPDVYDKEKVYIERRKEIYSFDFLLYDPVSRLDNFVKKIRIANIFGRKTILKVSSIDMISPVLSIFLTEEGKVKDINEIINHPRFKFLDIRIVNTFFSTKSFLKSVDFNNLTNEQLEMIGNALNITLNNYKMQNKVRDQKQKAYIEYAKKSKSIIKYITASLGYIDYLVGKEIDYYQDINNRNQRIGELENNINSIDSVEHKRH